MEYRKDPHRVYRLTYHLIFVVKYRKPVLDDEISAYIRNHVSRLLEQNNGSLIEFNSDKDHVHILFEITPDINLAHWIRGMKGALSRKVREQFKDRISQQLWGDELWTDSYFLTTAGGVTIDNLKQYVENQGRTKRKYVRKTERQPKG